MKSALVGYTGFVGGNLLHQAEFSSLYNSANISSLAGASLDVLVCAGVKAAKWWANQNPDKDWAGIEALLAVLKTVAVQQFVLISTVDVYPRPVGVDESVDMGRQPNHAYGFHRKEVEDFVRTRFPGALIIRLPGLFGVGLKKNVIYDLFHNNCIENINLESTFQYYYLNWLWSDIQQALKKSIKLLNIATEPMSTREIVRTFFPSMTGVGAKAGNVAHYDMHSRYAALWGGNGNYLYDRKAILAGLADFISKARSSARV